MLRAGLLALPRHVLLYVPVGKMDRSTFLFLFAAVQVFPDRAG